jgi:hypothetical protein
MTAADEFCDLLRARLTMAQHQPDDLAERGPLLRCDPLFEAGADLSDVVVGHAEGRVGAGVVREQALRVAALCARIYWVTVKGGGDGR